MEKHASTLKRLGFTPELPPPINPALMKHADERAKGSQNRIADAITRFSGSMAFVYLHIIWFASWIGFGVEKHPYGLLTMIVSLEAIFLSTFVMISQNRADAKRQVIADQEWTTVQDEDRQNDDAGPLKADPRPDEGRARLHDGCARPRRDSLGRRSQRHHAGCRRAASARRLAKGQWAQA